MDRHAVERRNDHTNRQTDRCDKNWKDKHTCIQKDRLADGKMNSLLEIRDKRKDRCMDEQIE